MDPFSPINAPIKNPIPKIAPWIRTHKTIAAPHPNFDRIFGSRMASTGCEAERNASRSDIAYGLPPDVLHQHAAVIEVSAQHGVEVFVGPDGLVVDPLGGAAAADFVQEGLHRGEVSFTK